MPRDYIVEALQRLARVPSAVPLGEQTLIDPDDDILVHYVQDALRPEFEALGLQSIVDLPLNQFAVRFGNGRGPVLLLMAYTPTQHNNLMRDPWSGRVRIPIELGYDEPCIFGQGVSQNKAHQAALLELARWISDENIDVNGTLWLAVNNEGRSSHDCSTAIIESLPRKPDFAVVLIQMGFQISVGNRGRIDIYVDIVGKASHSSDPEGGLSAIDGAAEVVQKIRAYDRQLTRSHPQLGPEHAVAYQVHYWPVAPHTLPERARITVDRRLLPGDEPREKVEELRSVVADTAPWTITVEPGVMMNPVLIEGEPTGLAVLEEAAADVLGRPVERTYFKGAYDAGGPFSHGIPTVMFGLPSEGDLLGDDFVRLSAVREEAAVLRELVRRFFE